MSFRTRYITSIKATCAYNKRSLNSYRDVSIAAINAKTSVGEFTEYMPVPMSKLLQDVNDISVKLKRPKTLRNIYVGIRHGESEANMEGIISSDPFIGTTKHGLTKTGIIQARRAAISLIEVISGRENLHKCIFYSSDFTRARETAQETLNTLKMLISYEEEPLLLYDILQSQQQQRQSLPTLQQQPQPIKIESTAGKVNEHSSSSRSIGSFKMSELTSTSRQQQEESIHTKQIILTLALRERYFGLLDATPLIFYNKVWPIDKVSLYTNCIYSSTALYITLRIPSYYSLLFV